MNEKQKLAEAKHFLQHMENEQNNPDDFRYETSAFLSAARSVLQYAQREVEGTRNQKWHDKRIGRTPIFGDFKDIRNENIHAKPVEIPMNMVAVENGDGRTNGLINGIEGWRTSRTGGIIKIYYKFEFFFPDTGSTKDVLELCHEYLIELELFVGEGIKRGAISG